MPQVESVPDVNEDSPREKRSYAKREKSAPKLGPVKIAAEEIVIPEQEATTEYHIGTLSSCPMHNVTLAGITFPRTLGGAANDDPERRGARVFLSDRQVDAIKAALKTKIVRRGRGQMAAGSLHSTLGKGFVPQVGDEWLAKHVYMNAVSPEVAKAMDSEPEAMA